MHHSVGNNVCRGPHKPGEDMMVRQQCSYMTNDIKTGCLLRNDHSDRYRRCKTVNGAREGHALTFLFMHRLLAELRLVLTYRILLCLKLLMSAAPYTHTFKRPQRPCMLASKLNH